MNLENLSFNAEKLHEKYSFPSSPLDTAIAYGSGVMGHGKGWLDFIFAVENPIDWHRANIDKNGLQDYSCVVKILEIRDLINGCISFARDKDWDFNKNVNSHFQTHQESGAGIYYCHSEFEGRKMKFGVLSKQRLLDDLEGWWDFYVSGRMQKPAVILHSSPEFEASQRKNLLSALRVALLYLPENFSWQELLDVTASLSYKGETRPEDPEKIQKISRKDPEAYQEWIAEAVQTLVGQGLLFVSDSFIEQNRTVDAMQDHLDQFPAALKGIDFNRLYISLLESGHEHVSPETILVVQNYIEREIRGIVAAKSKGQTMKGIASAGFSSIPYAGNKLVKTAKGWGKQLLFAS